MPNQFSHPWTEKEIEYVRSNIGKLTYDQIGLDINRSYASIQSKVRYLPFQKKVKKYSINSLFFRSWSPEMAYILGFIAADGNVYEVGNAHILQLGCDDLDVVEKMQEALGHDGIINKKERDNGKIAYSLRICDISLFNDLNVLGVTARKSLTITPPIIPEEYVHHYIRGYFDGDGSVSYRSGPYNKSRLVVDIYTASLNMASFLYEKIREQMGDLYKGKIYSTLAHQKTRYYAIRLGHKASIHLYKYMYKDANNLFMERKYNKFASELNYEA